MRKKRENFWGMCFFTIWLIANVIYGSMLDANVKINITDVLKIWMLYCMLIMVKKMISHGERVDFAKRNRQMLINKIQYIVPNGTEN